jgi:hypothetical protein
VLIQGWKRKNADKVSYRQKYIWNGSSKVPIITIIVGEGAGVVH